MPIAIAVGGGGFGIIALYVLRRVLREGRASRARAAERIASLRAIADQYEALLSGAREVTVFWTGSGPEAALGPKVLGQAAGILRQGQRPEALLKFSNWLPEASAEGLASAVERLRVEGRPFDLPLKTRDGQPVRALGSASGAGAVLRIIPEATVVPMVANTGDDPQRARRAARAGLPARRGRPAHLCQPRLPLALLAASARHGTRGCPARHHQRDAPSGPFVLGGAGTFDLAEFPVGDGRAGILVAKTDLALPSLAGGVEHLGGLIDALATPVAIFDKKRELVQFNQAYAELWSLDPDWLRPGLEERAILDRLRTDGMLPQEADYHAWRAKHLASSYNLTAPREHDPWHLPDGRTINVIAAPASPEGGVIYVFEDITQQLKLKSLNKALLDVQRSTINALTEAVAVFGTNGRLTLSNPRLSTIWKLPMNELGQNPHIDQLAEACGRAMEDGAAIWRDLKRSIIDLNPTRSDASGRITRADGKLIDYAVVRLPDGQTMMTFLDVTESANYSRVLKERNDALVTADRLKDAFVQNVSYELRSPLTNIIGFADLLASAEVGPLNERQRAYTDYIRASSATLGVLIDNILDLANVDAGIAQLHPEPQDIAPARREGARRPRRDLPRDRGREAAQPRDRSPAEARPPFIADGTRIVQVLYNLLSNAARYSEPGAPIRLSVRAQSERVIFVVEDEGAAMSEEIRAEIVEGADPGLTGRQRGAGLGLAIVRTFVYLHGGTVSLERREPRGSRVVVNLPADASAAGGHRAAAEPGLTWPTPSSSPTMPRPPRSAQSSRAVLRPGDLVTLSGDLGAGKTALARAIIRTLMGDPALECRRPTFALVQPYERGDLRILHADLYRLRADARPTSSASTIPTRSSSSSGRSARRPLLPARPAASRSRSPVGRRPRRPSSASATAARSRPRSGRMESHLFTIAPHGKFLDVLADRVLDGTLLGGWPREGAVLAQRRHHRPADPPRPAGAGRSLRAAAATCLLPDIRTFGGEETEEEPFLPPADGPALPHAAGRLERRLALAAMTVGRLWPRDQHGRSPRARRLARRGDRRSPRRGHSARARCATSRSAATSPPTGRRR